MKHRRPILPWKFILLLAVYGCIFLVFILTDLGAAWIHQDLGDGIGAAGSTEPCQQHGFRLLQFKQKATGQFNSQLCATSFLNLFLVSKITDSSLQRALVLTTVKSVSSLQWRAQRLSDEFKKSSSHSHIM
jgi:hypothetical protein